MYLLVMKEIFHNPGSVRKLACDPISFQPQLSTSPNQNRSRVTLVFNLYFSGYHHQVADLFFSPFRFASTWTFVTAVIYNFLFLHPRWSKHSISSIGAQAIWLFITWLFWVVGAIIVNSSIPKAINKSQCEGIVYCVQLRLLFAVAVVDR